MRKSSSGRHCGKTRRSWKHTMVMTRLWGSKIWKKQRGVPLRELISCWMDLPGSMLPVSPLATAWGSKQSSLSSARSAQHRNTTLEDGNVSANSTLFLFLTLSPPLSLSALLLPQELAAQCFCSLPSSLSLSLPPARAHNPCQQRNCERKKHKSLLSTSYPSLMSSCLILVVFHREVPQPITVTLHRHITAVHIAGFMQSTRRAWGHECLHWEVVPKDSRLFYMSIILNSLMQHCSSRGRGDKIIHLLWNVML